MSNNQRNLQIIQKLPILFSKLINLSITRAEKDILKDVFNELKDTGKITENERDILFAILNKITSIESREQIKNKLPTMNNATKARREQQLAQVLDLNEMYYLTNILVKLQGEPLERLYINPVFSGTFPNQQAFQDFIMTKSYIQESHRAIGKGSFGIVFKLNFGEQSFVLKGIIIKNEMSLMSVKNEIMALQQVIGKWYAVQLLASIILIDKDLTLENLGVAYILYPFIPGMTLEEYQDEIHPEEEEREIYLHIIQAVQQLHTDTKLLHSDIKPENIWIPTDRNIPPFLLDFGLSQSLDNAIAKNVGTREYWSEKRLLSKGKSRQRMTPNINWLALARTLGSELTNTNAHPLPPLRKRFKQLYHTTNENSIKKNNINNALTGTVRLLHNIQEARTKVRAQRMNGSARSSTYRSKRNRQNRNTLKIINTLKNNNAS